MRRKLSLSDYFRRAPCATGLCLFGERLNPLAASTLSGTFRLSLYSFAPSLSAPLAAMLVGHHIPGVGACQRPPVVLRVLRAATRRCCDLRRWHRDRLLRRCTRHSAPGSNPVRLISGKQTGRAENPRFVALYVGLTGGHRIPIGAPVDPALPAAALCECVCHCPYNVSRLADL